MPSRPVFANGTRHRLRLPRSVHPGRTTRMAFSSASLADVQESGWQVHNLGPDLPVDDVVEAVEATGPGGRLQRQRPAAG